MSEHSSSFQRKLGAILSYGQIGVHVIVSLLYTPLLLRLLGQQEYGLYSTIASAIAMICVLDLGFGGSYFRTFTRYRQKGEESRIRKLNGLFTAFYAVLALVIFLLGLYLSCHLEMVFRTGMTLSEYQTAKTLTVLVSANQALAFLSVVLNIYISAYERFVFLRTLEIVQLAGTPFIVLPLLLYGTGSVSMAAANLAFTVLLGVLKLHYARCMGFQVSFKNWEPGLVKQSFLFSSLIALILIADQINSNLDNVFLTRFCGTAEAAVNTVGASIYNYYNSFSTAISGVFLAQAYQMVAGYRQDSPEQRVALTAFFTRIGRLQFLLLALVGSGFVFFGRSFIRLWAGPGYERTYWVAVFRMLPATVPLIQNVGVEIQRAEYRHQYQGYTYFFMALLNAAMTYVICQIHGAPGAALATGVATLAAQGVIMNIVYHKRININVAFFWKSILRQFSGLLIPFGIGALLTRCVQTDTWLCFAGWVVVYACVYAAFAWRFSMNEEERNLIRSILKKLQYFRR